MSMLSRNTLNPADITVLFRNYSAMDPPPIDLVRTPQFLGECCMDCLMLHGVSECLGYDGFSLIRIK